MGRKPISLNINVDAFRKAVGDKLTWSDIAEKYGVTRQAVNGWLQDGRIPPRALMEIMKELKLEPEIVKAILEPYQKPKKQIVIRICFEDTPSGGQGHEGNEE
jgi:transcriptional regulator with XRE-family HTH domain